MRIRLSYQVATMDAPLLLILLIKGPGKSFIVTALSVICSTISRPQKMNSVLAMLPSK